MASDGPTAPVADGEFEELQDAAPPPRLRLTWTGWLGATIVAGIFCLAAFGRWIAPYSEADIVQFGGFAPPSADYPLGTDFIGRDLLSRLLAGAQVTIGISLAATALAYAIGLTLGITAALSRGWVDVGLSRVNDSFFAIPKIMLGLLAVAALGSSIAVLIGVAGVVYATGVFVISRSLALNVILLDYVQVAKARGEGHGWIVFREILPNIAIPLATDLGIRFVYVILFISTLSFLGLGVQPPMSDWGSMVHENLTGLMAGSLAPLAPALAIAATTVSVNLIVDDISSQTGGRLAGRMI